MDEGAQDVGGDGDRERHGHDRTLLRNGPAVSRPGVDRQAGDAVIEVNPGIVGVASQSRQFLIRAVPVLARDFGIRQFLDTGTGLPTLQNTHEVAQGLAPDARVVYVDNDPVVLAHAGRCCRTRRPRASPGTSTPRSVDQLAACFEGLELVEPGLVPITAWRPAVAEFGESAAPVDAYGALGRKP